MASLGKAKSNKDYNRIMNEKGPKLSEPDGQGGSKAPKQSTRQAMRTKLFQLTKRDTTPTAEKKRAERLRDKLEIFKPGSRQYDDAFDAAAKMINQKKPRRRAMIGG
jgi:hypothetical protein|tara:strand:- start:119 stop:439 length:321 start_codon:yes stop_codon:yes gene_type:complete